MRIWADRNIEPSGCKGAGLWSGNYYGGCADAGEAEHGADVLLRVVLRRWRPSADDVRDGECPLLRDEAVEVRVERAPCSPIAVGHALELHETFVGLLFPSTLPLVGRVADVERVIVSKSSWYSHSLFHLIEY